MKDKSRLVEENTVPSGNILRPIAEDFSREIVRADIPNEMMKDIQNSLNSASRIIYSSAIGKSEIEFNEQGQPIAYHPHKKWE